MGVFDIGSFKFFANKVLPTSYDDSLSYYEVLGKVANKLNEIADAANALADSLVKPYSATEPYEIGDYVWYNNQIWKCTNNNYGVFNPSDWGGEPVIFTESVGNDIKNFKTVVNGVIANQQSIIERTIVGIAVPYDNTVAYEVGQYVSYVTAEGAIVYKCIADTTAGTTPADTTKWKAVVIADDLKEYITTLWEGFFDNYTRTWGIVQETGTSQADAMSQKATTDEFKRLSRYTNNRETTVENANNIINLIGSQNTYVYVNKHYFSYNYKEYCYEVYGESVSGGGLFTIANYTSGLPSVFAPGSYTFVCDSKTYQGDNYTANLYLQVTIYNEGGDINYSVRGTQKITIPNTATGMRLRIMTTSAFSTTQEEPAKCYVRAYRYMTNKELAERVDALNNDALINMGVLPSGAISAITTPNSIYALVNANTYSDFPNTDTTTKYAFVKTLNTISMWEQTLITFATERNPDDAGEIWYRSGTSVHTTGNYNAWTKINVKQSELNKYAVYKDFPGTESSPVPIINIFDGHRFYSSYLLPNQTSTTLTNIQGALEVLVFGTQASRGYLGIQANKLALLVGTRDSSNDVVKNATAKLTSYEHNLAMFGDSITWGRDSGQSGVVATAHTFEKTIARNLGINATNFGVGSQGWLVAAGTPQYTAYQKIANTNIAPYTDFTLAWGVNDYTTVHANNWQLLGEYNTTDETTMVGQMYKTVAYIYSQVPNANVIIIPPWNGTSFGTFPKYKYTENGYNPMLAVMKEFAEYYGLPFIDMKSSPINAWTLQTWFNDGVHPNTNGYKIIGSWLAGEIAKLIG